MTLILHLVAALPTAGLALVVWRLARHRERVAATLVALLALVGVVLHPAVQHLADVWIAYPFAKRKEALAIEHQIVGKNYAFVVAKLGAPRRVRVESPTVATTSTRVITRRLESYQAMDYSVSPVIYRATRFIVFLDENGTVTSHRVKWEYGQGR